jgi:hypothetical protein
MRSKVDLHARAKQFLSEPLRDISSCAAGFDGAPRETGQSRLVWLRQMPEATKPAAMLGLIERLNRVYH